MDYLDLEALRRRIDPQEVKECFLCDECECEIYEGEEYYETEGLRLCEDCYDSRMYEEKHDNMRIAGED